MSSGRVGVCPTPGVENKRMASISAWRAPLSRSVLLKVPLLSSMRSSWRSFQQSRSSCAGVDDGNNGETREEIMGKTAMNLVAGWEKLFSTASWDETGDEPLKDI